MAQLRRNIPVHQFTIHYSPWNHTTRRLTGRQLATVTARTRWGALRAWWRSERQWHTLVKIHEVRPTHTRACQVEYPTHWAYACAHA